MRRESGPLTLWPPIGRDGPPHAFSPDCYRTPRPPQSPPPAHGSRRQHHHQHSYFLLYSTITISHIPCLTSLRDGSPLPLFLPRKEARRRRIGLSFLLLLPPPAAGPPAASPLLPSSSSIGGRSADAAQEGLLPPPPRYSIFLLERRRWGRARGGKKATGGGSPGDGEGFQHLVADGHLGVLPDRLRGADAAAGDGVAGAGSRRQGAGALLPHPAHRLLHGVEHRRQRRGQRHGDVGGFRRPHAPPGRAHRRRPRVLRRLPDGNPRHQHDAEGHPRGLCFPGERHSALRWPSLFPRSRRHMATGRIVLRMAGLHHSLYRRSDGRFRAGLRWSQRGVLGFPGEGGFVVGHLAGYGSSGLVLGLQVHSQGMFLIAGAAVYGF